MPYDDATRLCPKGAVMSEPQPTTSAGAPVASLRPMFAQRCEMDGAAPDRAKPPGSDSSTPYVEVT
jgi:hypothetical protein